MSAAVLDREKLAKLLGMIGSVHDGEALAAARQAERLRSDAGLTWPEILVPRLPGPQRGQNVRTVIEAIRFVLQHANVMTDWEVGFVEGIERQRSPLSPKQREILDRLVEKAQRTEARAA